MCETLPENSLEQRKKQALDRALRIPMRALHFFLSGLNMHPLFSGRKTMAHKKIERKKELDRRRKRRKERLRERVREAKTAKA